MRTNGAADLDLITAARLEARELPRINGLAHDSDVPAPGPVPQDLPPGYRVIRPVGRGAQGAVYEAVHETTGRRVALKCRRDDDSATADRSRLEREARLLARLNHPNLVTIFDCGRTSTGRCFVAMELIDGRPIDRFVRESHLSPAQIVALFVKIASAVGAAHLRGVVHRDIKPSNILVDERGEPRVLDFGLAKAAPAADSVAATRTADGFLGTLAWASPEQVRGRPDDLDLRTDVYSLGVVLYQLLTAHMPYDVDQPIGGVAEAIASAEPLPPRHLNRAIPRDVETILLKCLSKDRARRYGSAGELARDLECALEGRAIEARRDSALYLMRTMMRRHKLPTAIAASFLAVGMLSGLAMGGLYAQSQDELEAARIENEELRAQLEKLRARLVAPKSWVSAFRSAEELAELPPEEGWRVVQSAWSEMTEDHPKQQLLKMAHVAQPPYLLRVLNLGMSDRSPAVQSWAVQYLREVALRDFAEDYDAYGGWYRRHVEMPIEEVRRASLRRVAGELRRARGEELAAKLAMLDRAHIFRHQPTLAETAREEGMVDLLVGLMTAPSIDEETRRAAAGVLSSMALDEATLREEILPLLGDGHDPELRGEAASILAASKARFALPAMLDALADIASQPSPQRRGPLWAVAQGLSGLGDPRAIPAMIDVIAADDTYDTVYGVGYFGLSKLTGVQYEENHDGAWWTEWWERNRERFEQGE